MNRLPASLTVLALSFGFTACEKKAETPAPVKTAQAEPAKTEAKPAAAPAPAPKAEEPKAAEPEKVIAAVDMGDFGSEEPVERADLPQRGIIALEVGEKTFMNAEHWEQYNFPFKTKRWGKYRVRVNYTLKTSTLGVQFRMGETTLKKTLPNTSGAKRQMNLGEVYLSTAGDQFLALYTPQGVGYSTFMLHDITLIPVTEGAQVQQGGDGAVELLAKDATTWSESMRYEPKPEKNCLGFWTDVNDFAEWEIKMDKPGKYKVAVHQGSATGGSEVAVQLGDQQLKYTVPNTGDFHKHSEVSVGEVEIKAPGTYRLAIKPQTKNGGAIMDVAKVVLAPVS